MQVQSATLDPHRLQVYAVALEFRRCVMTLVPRRGDADVRDQLSRASLSIVLNIAEGAGRFSPADKARFYSMARGSACECAAILDVIAPAVSPFDIAPARSLLVRIVQMLTKLAARMRVGRVR
jgi:four helix bundle protein